VPIEKNARRGSRGNPGKLRRKTGEVKKREACDNRTNKGTVLGGQISSPKQKTKKKRGKPTIKEGRSVNRSTTSNSKTQQNRRN